MSQKVTVQDLPDEMLEKILLQLSLEDRKSALRVCKRWSVLKPFDLSSVQLVVDTERYRKCDYQDYHRALLASSRQYKHISVREYCNGYDLLVDIFRHFSRSVESLKVSLSRYEPTKLILFAKIVALLSNLKHLCIDVGGEFEFDQEDLEFCPMNNLEGLYLYNHLMPPNMHDITPNISRLRMPITSNESLNFLRHFSSQLMELEVYIASLPNFLALCTMQFPLLDRITLVCSSTMDLPGLKDISLLCPSVKNIQFLHLSLDYPDYCSSLDADSLRAICELTHLKSLHLDYFEISVPRELNFPPLESLRVLSLKVRICKLREFNRFCRHAFPSLAVLEMIEMQDTWMTISPVLSFKLYDSVCSNIPSLKRLVLVQSSCTLQLGPFLEFCASRAPREVRIRCNHVYDEYPLNQLRPIPVETLIMEVSSISPKSQRELIKSMGELKRLELAFRHPRDTIHPTVPDMMRSLREAFPRCEIVVGQKVQIEEPIYFSL